MDPDIAEGTISAGMITAETIPFKDWLEANKDVQPLLVKPLGEFRDDEEAGR